VKVGLDYWNVISHHPDVFRQLVAALLADGHEVHVISAIGRNRAGTVAGEIAALGIPVTAVHEVVFSHPRESPALKTAKCAELGISVFYDDRDDVCRAMTATGKILALRVTRPEPHAGRARKADIAAERLAPMTLKTWLP
jgi:acid phosphatase class B